MDFESTTLEKDTTSGTDILDLTADIEAFLVNCETATGWLLLFVPGSTAGLTTIEFESGAVNDLRRAIEKMAPTDVPYEHDRRWGDGNGYSHVRAALLGPSLLLPVANGVLATGTWQQPVLCDFDNRPRRRRVHLQFLATRS